MTEHESGEALQPPKKSSKQLVAELVERFAVDITDNNEDHCQYLSGYPLPKDSLGLLSTGPVDVAFEKFVEHESNDPPMYTIFIGSGSDTIFTLKMYDGELQGGYGERGHADDASLDADSVCPLLTKLSALMWLHERGFDSSELTEKTIVKTVVTAVKELATTPAYADDQDGDKLNYYPLRTSDAIWTSLKAEITWVSEDTAHYRLALVDDDHEIVDICVEGITNELIVTNYSGTEFEGDEGLRRTRIVFATLAEVITSNQIVVS